MGPLSFVGAETDVRIAPHMRKGSPGALELEPHTDQFEVVEATMPPGNCERLHRLLGNPVVATRAVRGGYTPALRLMLRLCSASPRMAGRRWRATPSRSSA
jgi:hypothetical protein